jgi:uncharacterized protein YbjQ (UPF0145 family)
MEGDATTAAVRALAALRHHQQAAAGDPHQQNTPASTAFADVSGLTVDQMVAVETVGYEAVGLVTGSSVYDIPLAGRRAYYKDNMEVTAFTFGLHQARLGALARIRAAAHEEGADGVLGVSFGLPGIPKDGDEIRLTATGTVVRARSDTDALRPRSHRGHSPFISSMNGRDFALLARAGYLPLGLVMGVCVFHVGRRHVTQVMKDLPRNTELKVITDALYQSRELAMSRMQDEATALHALGIVGVQVSENTHAWGSRVIEFMAIGTAVEMAAPTHRSLGPTVTVSLGATGPDVVFPKGH